MITYFDTSALVKKYCREEGSDTVVKLWRNSTDVATSSVAYAEAVAAFNRKKRTGDVTLEQLNGVINEFQEDWSSFVRVVVSEELNPIIDRLLKTHSLRGFDAIHLASAIFLHENLETEISFISADAELNAACEAERIRVVEP